MAHPLLPAQQASMPSLFLRAERHTGSNFLEEILRTNFKRGGSGDDATRNYLVEQYKSTHPNCTHNRLSIGSSCYTPDLLFSGCDIRGHEDDSEFCCWKHGYACDPVHYSPATSVLIVLVRSPYSFLPAMHKMPYETTDWEAKNMAFSDFLSRPWEAQPEYYDVNETAAGPIALWVDKMRSYKRYADNKHPTLVIRTTDLFHLEALEEKLSTLDSYHFSRQHASPVRYPEFSNDGDKWSGKFSNAGFQAARAATLQENWIKEYTQHDIDLVNAELDRMGAGELLDWAQVDRVRDVPSAVDASRTSATGRASTAAAKSNLLALNPSALHPLRDAIQLFDESLL